jgi:ATP-dependent Clp protease ATP-binding subunit ClpA
MARLIQERIKKPLANDLLFGELAHGGHVKISVKNNELTFTIKSQENALTT